MCKKLLKMLIIAGILFSTNVSAAGPDLTVGGITPTTAIMGVAKTYYATVSNIGDTSTGTSFPYFFQGATSINGGGTIFNVYVSSPMQTIDAGNSRVAISSAITFSLTGTFSGRACADKENATDSGVINESNENNNCGPWTNITVSSPTSPDLLAGSVTPVVATANVPTTFSAIISNEGSATPAGNITHLFQFDNDSNHTTVTASQTVQSSQIALGGNTTISSSYTFTAGTKYVRVCADENSSMVGTVNESNEGNNCGPWTAVTLTTASSFSDLTAGPVTPTVATVGIGTFFNGTISNIGDVSTGTSFPYFFQVSSGPNGTGEIGFFVSDMMSAVGATSSKIATSSLTTLSYPTVYSIRICADKENATDPGVIDESNENNNCGPWTNVTVSCPSGTTWNGSSACVPNVPTVDISANPINVSYNNSSKISWSSTDATSCSITKNGSLWQSGLSGTEVFSGLLISNTTFTANCTGAGGSVSDSVAVTVGTPPPPMSGTLSPATPSCIIAAGDSSCNIDFTWTTINPVGVSTITSPIKDNGAIGDTTVATGNSGTNVSFTVPYNSRTFYLYNNIQQLTQTTVTSNCNSYVSSWDGTKCASFPPIITSFYADPQDTTAPGNPSFLKWTSSADSCSSSDFNTGGASSNSSIGVQVNPLTTKTYHINCTGPGGNTPGSTTITVGTQKKDPKFKEN